MRADAAKLIWDAREALRSIQRFTAGKLFVDYQTDELLRSAVERQFIIVGEALAQLRAVDPATAARLEALPQVVAFRNVVVHAYSRIDQKLVWARVEIDVEPLAAQLDALLPPF